VRSSLNLARPADILLKPAADQIGGDARRAEPKADYVW